MVLLIVFAVLLTATLCIHVIGWGLRPKTVWSNILLCLGFVIVLCMGWQFYNAQQNVTQLRTTLSTNEAETATVKAVAAKAQLELEKFKAPRSLTDEQILRLKDKLRPFAGQNFGMITYWNVKEPTDFTKQIGDDVLIAAGWNFIKAERGEALIGVVTGIEVELSDESVQIAKDAAYTLVSALAAEDVVATIRNEPTYTTLIKIQVGMKP